MTKTPILPNGFFEGMREYILHIFRAYAACQIVNFCKHFTVLKDVQEQKNVCKYWRSDKQRNIFWKKLTFKYNHLVKCKVVHTCLEFRTSPQRDEIFFLLIYTIKKKKDSFACYITNFFGDLNWFESKKLETSQGTLHIFPL